MFCYTKSHSICRTNRFRDHSISFCQCCSISCTGWEGFHAQNFLWYRKEDVRATSLHTYNIIIQLFIKYTWTFWSILHSCKMQRQMCWVYMKHGWRHGVESTWNTGEGRGVESIWNTGEGRGVESIWNTGEGRGVESIRNTGEGIGLSLYETLVKAWVESIWNTGEYNGVGCIWNTGEDMGWVFFKHRWR